MSASPPGPADPVLAALHTRRSLRRYRPELPSQALLEQVLNAAIQAPSAHNRQPWRFVVLRDAERKAGLAQAMGAQLRADLQADGMPAALIEADVQRSWARMTGAPVLVLLCLSMQDMDDYPDVGRGQAEYMMAVQGTAMAGQNLLLAAHALGLGACWMCAPLFCPRSCLARADAAVGLAAAGSDNPRLAGADAQSRAATAGGAGSMALTGPVVCLAGGVGGSRLAHGLAQVLAPGQLTLIVNTADDFQHYGLHISPDLDTVMYTPRRVV